MSQPMRIRLLIDTVIDADELAHLAELIEAQATAVIDIGGFTEFKMPLGGRLVGAQPVHGEDLPQGGMR